ncbi:hypothetical protein ACIOMM_30675 [Streptomyces sp. NPDC087908]|uniref:hypothetical protein n=1 Tax=Streptomyces sp. NPDC087908 TaxID=3365820 RepID=UPI00382D55FA
MPLFHTRPVRAAQTAGGSTWPANAAAADAQLADLTALLAEAGVTVTAAAGTLTAPDLAAYPGDTTGIRVRTTSNPPHALYLIAAGRLTPHTTADSVFARLRPLIEAAARPCDGCGAEAGEPCNPNCTHD